ncbi:MAG: folate family ECF transporter S component [Lachnospiraceae bacterium]|nr:folate family ECF transporter S component [Lachnospiraceae bacterium]
MKDRVKKKFTVQRLVLMAVLIALHVVAVRFLSIQTPIFRISFGFIALVLAGVLLGPVEAMIVGALADLIGALLFPSGPFYPGFTLTAALTGLVFGLFLYKKVTVLRVIFSCAIVEFVLGLLLNTYWIHVLYGKGFLAILPTRAIQAGGMFVVQCVIILLLNQLLFKRLKGVVKEGKK